MLRLNRNDKLYVDSNTEGKTKVTFTHRNGAMVKADIYDTGLIAFEYVTEFGKSYKYSSNAGDFKIPNLVINKETGDLEPDSDHSAPSFALYSSVPKENKSTLEIPAMKLKLNFKMIDDTMCKAMEHGKHMSKMEEAEEEYK